MSTEQIEVIEEMASLQFSLDEVALIADVAKLAFEDNESKESRAYLKGRLKAQAEVRQSILEMAKQGSSPAYKQFLEMAKESEIELEEEN